MYSELKSSTSTMVHEYLVWMYLPVSWRAQSRIGTPDRLRWIWPGIAARPWDNRGKGYGKQRGFSMYLIHLFLKSWSYGFWINFFFGTSPDPNLTLYLYVTLHLSLNSWSYGPGSKIPIEFEICLILDWEQNKKKFKFKKSSFLRLP